MFAVVEIGGQQFEVVPNSIVKVPFIDYNPGDVLELNNILFFEDENGLKVGNPYLEGKVVVKIIAHGKDPKVIVFKKKRRKGYRRFKTHRQKFTKVEITEIQVN